MKKIDQIDVAECGSVIYREKTCEVVNDVEINASYHRWSLIPGSSLASISKEVADVCNMAWTPAVIAEYEKGSLTDSLVA